MTRRRVFLPDQPKRRVVVRQKLSPEAEELFTLPTKAAQQAPDPVQQSPDARAPDGASAHANPAPAKTPNWIIQTREVNLLDVGQTLGVEIEPIGDAEEHVIRPCPICGCDAGAVVELNPCWNVQQWSCPECSGQGGNPDRPPSRCWARSWESWTTTTRWP